VLPLGPSQPLALTFTPADAANYATVTAAATITVVDSKPAIDVQVWTDQAAAVSPIISPAFSTSQPNELLLAFIATDYNTGTNTSVTSVSGGGLTWVLVARTNVQAGTSEIWRAFAATRLTGVTVSASMSQPVSAMLTVVSFANVDTSGTNGSGAIGAVASANASFGGPSASLVTTRNNSWVFGVGNDYDRPIARTLGPGQTMVHQYLAPVGDTYWVQRTAALTPLAGTTVRLNDTAPTSDRYNFTICEIRGLQ
jgi:hypothetical protein